jgi:preprotein translocase subunit Sec63
MVRFVLFTVLVLLLARFVIAAVRAAGRAPPAEPNRSPPAGSPWDVLGVSPGASDEEIRAAYTKKMRENHPDRVADMAAEIREVAERRSKEINAAYDALKRR